MSDIPPVLNSRSCGRIATKIGLKFRPLALELGFNSADIAAFQVGHHMNLVGQNTEMLEEWVSRNSDKPDILPMFLARLRARTVGLNGFAKELEKRPDQEYGAPSAAPGAPPPAPGCAASSFPVQPAQVQEIPGGRDQPDSRDQSGPTKDTSWDVLPDESGSYAAHRMRLAQPRDDMLDPLHNYKLWSECKGLAYILNNNKFGNHERCGSKNDQMNMVHLFKELGYEIDNHEDLTGQEIKDSMKEFALKFDKKAYDSAVVVLMSHGNTGVIKGTDRAGVKLTDLHKELEDCHGLVNKPKMYFIQSCRGGLPVVFDDEPQPDSDFNDDYVKHLGDVYFAYSTTEGYKSLRNKVTGSYFIQAICEVFFAYAHQCSLDSLMGKVTSRLIRFAAENPGGKSTGQAAAETVAQTPERKSSMSKDLYFFPKFTKDVR